MVLYLDIETRVTRNEFPYAEKALEEISLIQVVADDAAYVYGVRDFVPQDDYKIGIEVKYTKCENEKEMLERFLNLLSVFKPRFVCAWNGIRFDFLYIYNRLLKHGIDVNRLSYDEDVTLDDNRIVSTNIRYVDLMILYKNLSGVTLKSYSLDTVSGFELNETKVKHEEFLDFDSFYTGKNYKIVELPYDDRVREEIRQLKILEQMAELGKYEFTEEQRKRMNDLIYFNYVHYGIIDSLLMKKIDKNKELTAKL